MNLLKLDNKRSNKMGYRSDVAYAIKFEDTAKGRELFAMFYSEYKVNEKFKLCWDEEKDSIDDVEDGVLIVDKDELLFRYEARGVKWYRDYEDVKCHEELLNMAKEYISTEEERTTAINNAQQAIWLENHDETLPPVGYYEELTLGYSYVRIGEDADDIDRSNGGNEHGAYMVNIRRSIEWNE